MPHARPDRARLADFERSSQGVSDYAADSRGFSGGTEAPEQRRCSSARRWSSCVRRCQYSSCSADVRPAKGTFPESTRRLHDAFDGLDAVELRMMLSENAARVYGFDLDGLRPVADDVGLPDDFFSAA